MARNTPVRRCQTTPAERAHERTMTVAEAEVVRRDREGQRRACVDHHLIDTLDRHSQRNADVAHHGLTVRDRESARQTDVAHHQIRAQERAAELALAAKREEEATRRMQTQMDAAKSVHRDMAGAAVDVLNARPWQNNVSVRSRVGGMKAQLDIHVY